LLPIAKRTDLTNRDGDYSGTLMWSHDADLRSSSASKSRVAHADELAQNVNVQIWCPDEFEFVETLQEAPRNEGYVDLMRKIGSGGFVAVKRMPNVWMKSGHREFMRSHPTEIERPWIDAGILKYLCEMQFPYVCQLQGVFKSAQETFVVSSLATEGDLFQWTERAPQPGAAREALVRPIAKQILAAVAWLHELDISHGDLSLENVLLTRTGEEQLTVKLVDFGMATLSQSSCSQVRGKTMYQAPEMHEHVEYDPMVADTFALGVLLFVLAWNEFPWRSTVHGECDSFGFVVKHGFQQYVAKQRLSAGSNEQFLKVASESIVDIIEGLLIVEPERRLTLRKRSWHACFVEKYVWDLAWLREG
jgi:serine/threonine protein kinase